MPTRHTVSQGESISSIAVLYGHFPQTVWDDPANEALRKKRENPNLLLPGDVVVVPDKVTKEAPVQTGKVHRFRRKGVPEVLRLQLREYGKPRAGASFLLDVDGVLHKGQTNAQGVLQVTVPNSSRKAVLRIGKGEVYTIDISHVDPLEGEQANPRRLVNLNFLKGEEQGDEKALRRAVRAFQQAHELDATGELDGPTRQKLREVHGY
jgi:N-acetylmuramoyl-L-alanine amidase